MKVATLDEVPEFSVVAVQLAGNSLILHRQGATVKCYRNACSHLGYPLEKGKVEDGFITCPSHGFQYKLETGECLTAPDISLHSYPVKIKDDKVFVKLQK
jgi:nitrite reductase/ring-hydroxylating ferredoxin subunit